MSIYAYVGLPGSGKSYGVVANQILPALKEGRRVVTNVPLNLEVVREMVPDAEVHDFPIDSIKQSPELIDEYARPGSVLVIDELWKLFPVGQKANQVPEPYKKLLAEHRHMVGEDGFSTQIVFVTQDLAQIAAFARQLVEQTFHHTKLTHIGTSGSYRVDVYQGGQTGNNPPRQARLREMFGRYDKAIFALYKSHTMSETGKAGNERSVDKRGNIWRRPMLWVAVAGVVAATVWGIPTAVALFHKPKAGAAGASGATTRAPRSAGFMAGSPLGGSLRGVSQPVMEPAVLRVTGYILYPSNPGESVAFVGGTDQPARTISFAPACVLGLRKVVTCRVDGQVFTSSYGATSTVVLPQPERPVVNHGHRVPPTVNLPHARAGGSLSEPKMEGPVS